MDAEAARNYAFRTAPRRPEVRVSVAVALRSGTHHTISLLGRDRQGNLVEDRREGHATRLDDLVLETKVGNVVHQRTTSPASADALERYGVVLADGRIDWGTDADWTTDFGPAGDVTRRGLRSPTASFRVRRERVLSAEGEEVVGGAAEGTRGTSLGSS